MTGPELDLLEGGCRGDPVYRDPGGRIDLAFACENARNGHGQTLRPWAGIVLAGNADYVSRLALRARFRARGITHSLIGYQRYYQLKMPR
jgi:hypothetical protein